MPYIHTTREINCPELQCMYCENRADLRVTVSDPPADVNIVMCRACMELLASGDRMLAELRKKEEKYDPEN